MQASVFLEAIEEEEDKKLLKDRPRGFRSDCGSGLRAYKKGSLFQGLSVLGLGVSGLQIHIQGLQFEFRSGGSVVPL